VCPLLWRGARNSPGQDRLQVRAEREVVVLVPGEASQVEHDDKVRAALVQAAEGEQLLKLAAIRGLGALAFPVKAFEDLTVLPAVRRRRGGDDTLQAWRERPRLWPRASSQTRSNLVVAHATVTSLVRR
jgi:hypothetical protein